MLFPQREDAIVLKRCHWFVFWSCELGIDWRYLMFPELEYILASLRPTTDFCSNNRLTNTAVVTSTAQLMIQDKADKCWNRIRIPGVQTSWKPLGCYMDLSKDLVYPYVIMNSNVEFILYFLTAFPTLSRDYALSGSIPVRNRTQVLTI